MATKTWPSALTLLSTTGWRPPTMAKARDVVDGGADEAAGGGQMREAGGDVELGEGVGKGADAVGLGEDGGGEPGEDRGLDLERLFVRAGDAAFELGQLGGGEAHGVGHGLAMDESRAVRLFQQACRHGRRALRRNSRARHCA